MGLDGRAADPNDFKPNGCTKIHVNEISLFRCLASPTRLAVVRQLRVHGQVCVGDLVKATGAERTNLSHQLRELRACGLVTDHPEGKRVFYRLAHPRLAALVDLGEEIAEHMACTDPACCQEVGCC